MGILRHKNIFFAISGILVALSIFFIIFDGLKFGIDFTGGTIVEVSFGEERPQKEEVEESLDEVLGESRYVLQEIGENGLLARTAFLTEENRGDVVSALTFDREDASVERVNSIGPSVGKELKSKALVAIVIVVVAIILFIAFTFRKVSEPVSSWKYGIVAILTLLHDIIIPTGAFALLGTMFVAAEVDLLFVMAMLAILGLSINDTIVIFDRIRENLALNKERHIKEPFEKTVGKSLEETYARSLNTSLTTLFVIIALLLFGASSTKMFALALTIGTVAGIYSSLFIAAPLLVKLEEWQKKA